MMTAFDYFDDIDQTALNLAILSRGPVGLYRSADELSGATKALVGLGYEAVTLDATEWRADSQLFDAFDEALDFPEYFGRNWDAFDEVISDIGSGELCWPRDATGLVVVVEHAEDFSTASRQALPLLVRIFADASRRAALFGNRLILLLHVGEETGASIESSVATPAARWQ
jgi:RNAse (barnase) inhibitor barstar